MPRQKRNTCPGLIRHITARGNGRMKIFEDSRSCGLFLALLGDVVQDFEIRCWNYCVMPNHYHLTLEPTLPNLSAAMQRLDGDYARWWNRRHARVGHVFQGRFDDQIVQREGYLLNVCRYVALNPVRAGLVKRPEDWRWSSYAATIGLKPAPPFLDVTATLGQFAPGDAPMMQTRFRSYVLGEPDDIADERIRSWRRVVGDRSFRVTVGAIAGPQTDSAMHAAN